MSIYEFEVRTIDGQTQSMGVWRGKLLLIVNVASRCGYTPQYAGLEALYRKYADRGLVVLGFPCNQFGAQEPGDEAAIKTFCTTQYHVSFPMFAKVAVNGDAAHPLYRHLRRAQTGILGTESIKWNFTKFLVDREGRVLKRYGSAETPQAIEADLQPLLP